MMPQFPVNLELSGRRVLVVGAGRIALRKTDQLLSCGASVVVVAPAFIPDFASRPVVRLERPFEVSDLDDAWLVITATGVRAVDQLVHDEANRRRIWVNSADDPERCSFTLPAVVRRGRLMVTTSTAGASPALSSFLRSRLGEILTPEWSDVVEELSKRRDEFHRDGISTEDVDWSPILAEVLDRFGVRLPVPLGRIEA
ncbi:MAG: precorrin-2 dehydrogenase [Acidimicrobiales bacterium mtb01]|nr:bifunctional precorrin-2 dehydrogenase/sirohydrochlorin ferrochelatase [Actinomycetota bacterium]TEX47840.1 MAG: precorrin-2 dehydrogenase [Acidimicrobiales bacterium mtb01]